MAILEKEPVCFPSDLLDVDFTDAVPGRNWWAIHTRPRAEKSLARKLRTREIAYYLPQYERRYRRQRRLVRSHLPLFPGYVFLYADEAGRSIAAKSGDAANVIPVPNQQKFTGDLRSIQELISSGVQIAPEERLEPGARAEIISGPFRGREGTVLRRGGRLRLIIAVDFLHKGASVEVETSDIRWIP